MEFKGKVDAWFYLLMTAIFLMPAFILYTDQSSSILVLVVFIAYYAIVALVFIPMIAINRVVLEEDYFIVYFSFSKTIVLLSDIITMYKTHDLTAGGACSLDRIYIDTKQKDMLIALQKNDAFIEEVKKRNPNIH